MAKALDEYDWQGRKLYNYILHHLYVCTSDIWKVHRQKWKWRAQGARIGVDPWTFQRQHFWYSKTLNVQVCPLLQGNQLNSISAYNNKWLLKIWKLQRHFRKMFKKWPHISSNSVVSFGCSGLDRAPVSCEAVSYVGKWNEASKVMNAKKEHYYIVWRKEI